MKSYLYIIAQSIKIIAVCWLLVACANESVPQGGEKDNTPPKLKRSIPQNGTTHFSSSKIELQFNEYLRPTGFNQTIISPDIDKKPTYTVSGKKLIMKINSELKPNTTYTINFGEDIQDLNESNKLENFTYVFSTGDYIDSLSIKGKILNAKDNSPVENTIASLYAKDSTKDITNCKPQYFTKCAKDGSFTIRNIKPGEYFVYGLKDQNYNFIYDQPNELIAFYNNAINITDSFVKNIDLSLFDELPEKVKLTDYRSEVPGNTIFCFNQTINNIKIKSSPSLLEEFVSANETKDTISYWYSNIYAKKVTLLITVNDTITDTLRMDLKTMSTDSLKNIRSNSLYIVNQGIASKMGGIDVNDNRKEELFKPFKINLSRPITEINKNKHVQIYKDSSLLNQLVDLQIDKNDSRQISFALNKTENTKYKIILPDSILSDFSGMWNKQLVYQCSTDNKTNYGNISITLQCDSTDKNYLIELYNETDRLINKYPITTLQSKKLSIENIPVGSYKFRVIDDLNNNGKWDTGIFKDKKQPERVIMFKEAYQLKGGWDLDITLKL